MSVRSGVYILLMIILGVFVLANWTAITHPTDLNLLVGTVRLPLGIAMLSGIFLAVAVGLIILEFNRLAWHRERQSLVAERERFRLLAEQAEESRIQALRQSFEHESTAIRQKLDDILVQLKSAPDTHRRNADSTVNP